jgi:CHAD domain-containing protein
MEIDTPADDKPYALAWTCPKCGNKQKITVPGTFRMDAQTLLLEALDSRWEQYREKLHACRREHTAGTVHALRVAARRLLALTGLIRSLMPHARLKKLRSALKEQLHGFNRLRDTQVMLAETAGERKLRPALKPFRQKLRKRERRLRRQARAHVAALKPGWLSKRLKNARADVSAKGADKELESLLLQATDDAFQNVLRRYRRIDPARPATVHRTRVAFKRFRYTLEIIQPLLKAYPEAGLARVHAHQAAMGALQDADVLLHTLEDFEQRKGAGTPAPILRHYARRVIDLTSAYVKDKEKLLTYWRASPGQPFPWEFRHETVHRPSRHRRSAGNPARQRARAHPRRARENAQDRARPDRAERQG